MKEEDNDKAEILSDKDEDKDSGNNSSDNPEDEAECENLLQSEDVNHLIEASRPKFSSPVWLDEIQNNKIFNKQKSINTEESETPKRSKRTFPVRSISEIIDSESDSDDTEKRVVISQDSTDNNVNNNINTKPDNNTDNADITDNGSVPDRPVRETDL